MRVALAIIVLFLLGTTLLEYHQTELVYNDLDVDILFEPYYTPDPLLEQSPNDNCWDQAWNRFNPACNLRLTGVI